MKGGRASGSLPFESATSEASRFQTIATLGNAAQPNAD
jgi:hypothetical protein